jgi:hypothetical protein
MCPGGNRGTEISRCLTKKEPTKPTLLTDKAMTKIPKYPGIVKSGIPRSSAKDVTETPYKYNGGYNYTEGSQPTTKRTPYTICIDWLSVTCTGYLFHSASEAPAVLNFGDVELKRKMGGTAHYAYRYEVNYKGEPFAVLLTVPRRGGALEANRADFSELKLHNHILYRDGWHNMLMGFIQATGLQFYHVTRVDIALDGYNMLDIFRKVDERQLRAIGRAKFHPKKDEKDKDGFHVLTGANWGSRSSDKHLTAYRVGKRVEAENKGYRVAFWKKNGLTDSEAVERLELKLKAKAVQRIVQAETGEVGAQLEQLNDPAFLAGMMQAHFAKWFEFRIPDPKQKNISRLKKAHVIDWQSIEALEVERLPTTRKPNKVWAAKRCATKLLEDNGAEYIPRAVKEYLKEHGDRAIKRDAWAKAEKAAEQYLRLHFPYMLPSGVVSGLVDNLRQTIGTEYAKQLDDSVLADLPRRLAFAVANQHGAGAWLHRKNANLQAST